MADSSDTILAQLLCIAVLALPVLGVIGMALEFVWAGKRLQKKIDELGSEEDTHVR